MKSVQEFRADLLDKIQVDSLYNYIDREEFSVIDLALTGDDGEVAAFRIIITPLPRVFEEDERVAEKVGNFIKTAK